MRFKLHMYKTSYDTIRAVVEDTQTGAWLLRDQSNYNPEEMVWKNAAYPYAVAQEVREGAGVVILETDYKFLLDANISDKSLTNLWKNTH